MRIECINICKDENTAFVRAAWHMMKAKWCLNSTDRELEGLRESIKLGMIDNGFTEHIENIENI